MNGTPTSSTYQSGTNRLATVGGSSVSINAEGRTTAVPGYTYLYNNAGRLSTVKQGSTTKGTYAYDASGLRRRKVASGVTTIYHFDEAGHLLAETNTSGVMQRLYVWADGAPVAQKVSTTLTYLHTDHLDTPRWGTSTAGALVWRWKSDGFGEALPEQDPDGNGTQVSVNLRFPGQYYDAESGLHRNWMRDYTPGYGRYTQSDPIGLGGGLNTFAYVVGNPVRFVDPAGLKGLLPPGVLGQIYAGDFAGGALDFAQAFANQWWATEVAGRAHNGWANQDKYFHCRANCEAAQRGEGGRDAAECISDAREAYDQGWPKYDSAESSAADQVANQSGRSGGSAQPEGSCREICGSYRPPGTFPPGF